MMKLTLLALFGSLVLAGASAAFWGNLVVLALTVGIFLATLSLGRKTEATRSQ